MSELVALEVYPDFFSANCRAKHFAQTHNAEITIRITVYGWEVIGPSWIELCLDEVYNDFHEQETPVTTKLEPYTCPLCMGFGHSPLGGKCYHCLGSGVVERDDVQVRF